MNGRVDVKFIVFFFGKSWREKCGIEYILKINDVQLEIMKGQINERTKLLIESEFMIFYFKKKTREKDLQ